MFSINTTKSNTTHQAWLRASVEHEVMIGTVDADELAEGRMRALVGVHSAAMMQLIASDDVVIPETLLLDTQRINYMRKEFRFLVTASTMLVSLASSLSGEEAGRLGQEIFAPATELESIIEAVAVELKVSPDEQKSILYKLEQCAQPTDALHGLM